MGNTGKRHYSDSELIEILEENGYEVSYGQVERLRAGLESGEIEIGNFLTEEEELEIVEYLHSLSEEEYLENKEKYDAILKSIDEGTSLDEGLFGWVRGAFNKTGTFNRNKNRSVSNSGNTTNTNNSTSNTFSSNSGNTMSVKNNDNRSVSNSGNTTSNVSDNSDHSYSVNNSKSVNTPQTTNLSNVGNQTVSGNVISNIGSGNTYSSGGGNGGSANGGAANGGSGGNIKTTGGKGQIGFGNNAKVSGAGTTGHGNNSGSTTGGGAKAGSANGGNAGHGGNVTGNGNMSRAIIGGISGNNSANNSIKQSVSVREGADAVDNGNIEITETIATSNTGNQNVSGNHVTDIGANNKIESNSGNVTDKQDLKEMNIASIVSSYVNNGGEYSHREIINTCMKYCLTEADESSISGITVFMEKVEKEIKQQEAAKEQKAASTADDAAKEQAAAAVSKNIVVTPDGDLQVAMVDKQVTIANDGTLNVSIAESKQRTSRTNYVLESYLTEDCGFTLNEFKALTEETKVESIREIAIEVLKAVEEKLQAADTSCADRSRGDIKKLVELPSIQDAITKLEALIERDEHSTPAYTQYIGTIIKSILYINQYSAVFKDAYRNKKTLMMLKYESLILAIIASISYALSTIVEYKANQISLKQIPNEELLNFAPYKTLEAFNKSVDSGEFKIIAGDVTVLREFFLEVPVEQMGVVLEAADFLPLIVNGVKGVLSALDNNSGKVSSYLYKAVGIIILIFSLREVIYTIEKMKTKVPDMLSAISNFANLNNGGGILSKLTSFANKFASDAENGSELTQREIEDENRRMATKVRKVQSASVISSPAPDPVVKAAVEKGYENPADDGIFGFDF